MGNLWPSGNPYSVGSLLAAVLSLTMGAAMASERTRLIDDFSGDLSTLGTRWQGFTDRVMGGRSDLQAGYDTRDGEPILVLRGQVRLDNNGGFVQVRLPLDVEGRPVNAGSAGGLRVTARAVIPGPYYVHLRTTDTRRPWAYYRAPLSLGADWTVVTVPWSAFEARSLDRALDPGRLTSLALVAYGEEFEAHLEVMRLEWLPLSEE